MERQLFLKDGGALADSRWSSANTTIAGYIKPGELFMQAARVEGSLLTKAGGYMARAIHLRSNYKSNI